jgi:hypothetical protein
VVQCRTMSHTEVGIVRATTDSFILFENSVRRNRLMLPGVSNAADHASGRNCTIEQGLWRPGKHGLSPMS